MHSCIYEGWVRHRRFRPVEHSFRNKIYLMYLDLSELDKVFQGRWFWSTRGLSLAQYRRSDHFGDPNQPLDECVKDFVEGQGGSRPEGPVRMLAHLRYFGYAFNPVSFFYCFDCDENLQYVVAEVTNTPWGERHCYVISQEQFAATQATPSSDKDFHVSPFMPMDLEYCWQISPPEESLVVRITNFEKSNTTPEPFFDALLQLQRKKITSWNLMRVLVRYPLMTFQVVASIYFQALRLWWKGCPFYSHPKKETTDLGEPSSLEDQSIADSKKASTKASDFGTDTDQQRNEIEIHS